MPLVGCAEALSLNWRCIGKQVRLSKGDVKSPLLLEAYVVVGQGEAIYVTLGKPSSICADIRGGGLTWW